MQLEEDITILQFKLVQSVLQQLMQETRTKSMGDLVAVVNRASVEAGLRTCTRLCLV